MAISLKKGQKVDLTKSNPGLSKLLIGLGWDTNKYSFSDRMKRSRVTRTSFSTEISSTLRAA